MKKATIAILMATYNGEKYLRPQLESLLAQTEQDWQLLISDDGSTDATPDILAEYREKYPEKIQLLRQEKPAGCSKGNFMFLVRCAEGYPYLMCCDQDDVWKPDKVALTLAKMRELEAGQPQIPCLVHTDLAVVGADLTPCHDSFFHSSWLDARRCHLNQVVIQNIVTGCTMMINAALRQLALLPADPEGMLMHDWWMALIAAALGRIGFLPQATILYRQHSDNVVGAKEIRGLKPMIGWTRRLPAHRQALINTERQAGAFAEAMGSRLSGEQLRLLREYASIRKHGKPGRWAMVARHRIWLTGWKRRIGEILLI